MLKVLILYIFAAIAVFIDASLAAPIGPLMPEAGQIRVFLYGFFVFCSIALSCFYAIKYSDTTNIYGTQSIVTHPSSGFNLLELSQKLKDRLRKLGIIQYVEEIYEAPVKSELILGKFFFGKTLVTTMIAFYDETFAVLAAIILFSTIFDSLTGFYQQTLMNFFHRTFFKNKILIFFQNLTKRFMLDIFRAEVITLLFLGLEIFTTANQWHILINRLVSATYYFNAVLIDQLVALNAICRDFRAKLIIWASTIGGLLCILHLGKTKMPYWMPQEIVPSWLPGPLGALMIFNFTLFIILGSRYIYITQIKPIVGPADTVASVSS